jgi:steroid delta-isomerase
MAPDSRETIRRYFAATRAMDREAWVACFAEDGRSFDPVGSPPHVGREALRRFFDSIAGRFRQVGLSEDCAFPCGQRVAVKWTGRGTSKTGKAVVFEGIDVFDLGPDGRIRSLEAYWDAAGLLAELGGPAGA